MTTHRSKIMKSDMFFFGSLKTFTCPTCGKSLINLATEENQREFWCDCNDMTFIIDIMEDED